MTTETKPSSNLDTILRDLLSKNPDLMKDVQKQLGIKSESSATKQSPPTVQTPKKYRRTAPDYRLLIFSGCETCHHITEIGYEMAFDENSNCFRPKVLSNKNPKAFVKTEKQLITTNTCPCCEEELSLLTATEVVSLLLLLQKPLEVDKRTMAFKSLMRKQIAGIEE